MLVNITSDAEAMPVNKPVGDNARKGAVRKRSQLKTAIEGEEHWTKRSKEPVNSWIRKKVLRPSRSKACAKNVARRKANWLSAAVFTSSTDPAALRC